MEHGIHVMLSAEKIGSVLGVPITNTLITSWIVMAILIITALVVRRNIALVPGRVQALFETVLSFVREFMEEVLGTESLARRYAPLLLTLFFFIFTANVLEFIPGIGSIGLSRGNEFVPLLRSVNTDLNVTLALTIIVVAVIECAGIAALGARRYAGKFFDFSSPLRFFVGLLELVSELSRFISFSFRLFGNIFAGEVLIGVVTYFLPYIVPVPFMGFEMFIGFVQAAVFALLTLFFIKLAVADPHDSH